MSPFLVIFLIIAVSCPAEAIQYAVIDNATSTPGSTRFEKEIGRHYTLEAIQDATEFVLNIFKLSEFRDRKSFDKITVILSIFSSAAAITRNNTIFVNAEYINTFPGKVAVEFAGIIYHEATHVWQWKGNGEAPKGLTEGIADYIPSPYWPLRGTGMRWDQGYAVTAYFLEYCNGLRDGFVAELNAMMKNGYSDRFFEKLLGKNVDDLWDNYKSKYGN
ncbi:hypothetical protein L6164_016680 [Bauhinia variegata]|uniref:Uncharacterized protein n=1 Tax=Bauhinia variegata TaxID=167791 RepID=A0ACB9NQ96_BAUVA|nr:hypothetical protein L6164_016680 [Bauhinia variegata]